MADENRPGSGRPESRSNVGQVVAKAHAPRIEPSPLVQSVDQVLERSGTGKSQFYQYFDGKDALVGAVLDYRLEEDLARLGDLLERLDNWEAIRSWFTGTVEL